MTLPTKLSLEETQRNMDSINEFVFSTQSTLTTQYNDNKKTLTGLDLAFQERFTNSVTVIAWGQSVSVSDTLQRYSTGTLGESGYREWLPNPVKVPFTTGSSFSDDLDSEYWIEHNSITISGGSSHTFDSRSDMQANASSRGVKLGDVLTTKTAFNSAHGGWRYEVTNDTPNGLDIIDLGNGLSAKAMLTGDPIPAGAFGAKLDWDGNTGTNDFPALNRIHSLGLNYTLQGKFALILGGNLQMSSRMRVHCDGGGIRKNDAGYIFSSNTSVLKDFLVTGGTFGGNGVAGLCDCTGVSDGLNNSVSQVVFEDCSASGVTICFNWDNARSCAVIRGRYSCQIGVKQRNKAAENIIDSVLFTKGEEFAVTGSAGIISIAGPYGYPEGLSCHKTTMFRFEHQVNIDDLYIGDFTGCYFDAALTERKPSRIAYNTKTEGIKFTNCWFYAKGIEWGNATANAPKLMRSIMSGCHFCYMEPGIDVLLHKFTHDMVCTSNVHDSRNTGVHVGYVANEQNNGIVISDINFKNYDTYVQFKVAGQGNSVANIPNRDNIPAPLSIDYPVNVSNVEGFGVLRDVDIVQGTYTAGQAIASSSSVTLSGGIALINIELTAMTPGGTGYVEIRIYDPGTTDINTDVTFPANLQYLPYTVNDRSLRACIPVKVNKATKCDILVRNEGSSPSLVAGQSFNSLTITQ